MKTGIELITQERKEQIEKHGYDKAHDSKYYNRELIRAALFCIDNIFEMPHDWDRNIMLNILSKNRIGRLKTAGAFIAAEIDRLNNK